MIQVNQGPLPDKPLRRPIFGVWEYQHSGELVEWRARIITPEPGYWRVDCCDYPRGHSWGHTYTSGWAILKYMLNGGSLGAGTCVAWMYL